MSKSFQPTLLYQEGRFLSGKQLDVDDAGRITVTARDATPVDLKGKALLPGFVNAHSHSFQRLIRGRAESRAVSGKDFWSWRNTMYQAAAHLSPEEVYDVARMCFLEMARAGITTVGEFHYLHNMPDGTPYDDPNLIAHQVIAAAQSIGLRIVLLRSAYLRSGYQLPLDPGQRRFFENVDAFLSNIASLGASYPENAADVRFGVAPHSIRAVPLDELHEIVSWARSNSLPIHMHVAEQIAENVECQREYGYTPVELLAREELLGKDFVAVHAIHLSSEEIPTFAKTRAIVCSCPTTERNLGDGIVQVDALMKLGVRHALGSDSQAQIDSLEDARQLDYHLRLTQQQRAVLDQIDGRPIAQRLFDSATVHGAHALAVESGSLRPGEYGDMVSIDLEDISVAGHTPDTLLPLIVFGANRTAIRDVVVNGKTILQNGRHPLEEEIVSRYQQVYRRVWGGRVLRWESPVSAVIDHLSNLIRIPSVSAMPNRPITDYASSVLMARGWTTREMTYIDGAGTEKVNLIAAPPGQDVADRAIDLAFLCHTDTVPYAKDWLQALRPVRQGAMLHGCGACDVKGFLACLLAAAESKGAQWINGLRIVLTADEEVGCIGTQQLIATDSLRPRRLVVGEPTLLRAARAGKGYCLAQVTIHGREAHSALPEQGVSAIYAAARLVSAVEGLGQQLTIEKHDFFNPSFTTLNVGTIEGGSAKNIIPGRTDLLIEWRPIPGLSSDRIPAALCEMLECLQAQYPGVRGSLAILREQAGFETAADSSLVRFIESVTAQPATSIAFGSEASAWSTVAEEVVVFGPGDMRSAHSDRECVSVDELTTATQAVNSLMQGRS